MLQTISVEGQDTQYERYVNPQWVRLLDVLGMNVRYVRCLGAELFTSDGRRILDFISGYCVHNPGHNHPRIIAAIKEASSGFSVGTPNRLWWVRMPWISQPRGAGTGRAHRSGSRSRSCSARGS
ncbi:MAG: aminotransferase class III-fold pyridoxal phosphate-dependent enzyme, partial [Candidatus Methylomirabilales bacterium]